MECVRGHSSVLSLGWNGSVFEAEAGLLTRVRTGSTGQVAGYRGIGAGVDGVHPAYGGRRTEYGGIRKMGNTE